MMNIAWTSRLLRADQKNVEPRMDTKEYILIVEYHIISYTIAPPPQIPGSDQYSLYSILSVHALPVGRDTYSTHIATGQSRFRTEQQRVAHTRNSAGSATGAGYW